MRKLTLAEYRERYPDRSACPDRGPVLREAEAADFRLPGRKPDSHKYSYGRALLIAGSTGFSGAPALAANACERSGAGLTQLMVPESIYVIAAARCDGAVVTPLPATEQGRISETAVPRVLEQLKKAQACVIGPGLGLGTDTKEVVRAVLREALCPLVLDADALTICAGERDMLSDCRAPLLLTPHEGEFRRMGWDPEDGRVGGALRFVAEHPNAILILKGCGTLVCREGEVSVNPTGGPAMAKGGSGDVLSGILCALLAQGFEPWLAARCAVWLHGLSGDLAASELGEYALAPSDLIRYLPSAMRAITERA